MAVHYGCIRRNPIALGDNEKVAADNFPPSDLHSVAIPNHQRSRASQIAQGLQYSLAAGLLDDGDDDGERGKDKQENSLHEIAQNQIHDTACDQQREHGLPHHFEGDPKDAPPLRCRQFVVPVGLQSVCSFDGTEAPKGRRPHGGTIEEASVCMRFRLPCMPPDDV